jgi:hypothetical protein
MKKLSGWQKAGLFVGVGCFSIVAMGVLALVIAVVWARSTLADVGDTTPTKVERAIALPEVPAPGPNAAAGAAAGSGSAATEPLRLTVDLEEGEFTVQPGPPGSQVQVQGMFSPNLYELTEDRAAADGGPARTTIRFRSKAPAWARVLAGFGGGGSRARPQLTVIIPEDVPIELNLRLSMGESRVDLGGLALRNLDVEVSMGEHRIDFTRPVTGELGRVRLDANMGNIALSNLGNARALAVEASGNMGNLTADLGGAWQPGADSELQFSHNMGELTVRVPMGVRLDSDIRNEQGENQGSRADSAERVDANAPHVRLRISTSMGGSRVIRY